jgi:uncharacterized repeat protein (TIGR01451 family)
VDAEMVASATEVEQDDMVSFTITMHNRWDEGINQVIVADYMPEGLTFVQSTASQGEVIWEDGLVWASVGTLPADTSATVTIMAKVDPEVENGTTILNRAAVYHSQNVAVQTEASVEIVKAKNGVLPVTGMPSLLPVIGGLLVILFWGIRGFWRTAR